MPLPLTFHATSIILCAVETGGPRSGPIRVYKLADKIADNAI